MKNLVYKSVDWSKKRILVTGGASFIGSHLIDHLVNLGAVSIRVVDDLSTGKLANIQSHIDKGIINFIKGNLLENKVSMEAVEGIDVVFHLAAIHGGRGYIDMNQAQCSQNFLLDGNIISEAYKAGVDKFVFASSGCVYPTELQSNVNEKVYLSEDMVGPGYNADGMYGWAKLMSEMTLKAYYQDYGFKSVSCRFFTVYGERCLESHAIMAMIGRAYLRQDPYEIWGDGTQIRNWTYVADIVEGMVLAAEKIDDGSAINLGTEEPIQVLEAANFILKHSGHNAQIKLRTDMPTGPLNRVASNKLALEILNWEPKYSFKEGLQKTIEWYFENKKEENYLEDFENRLLQR